ncbi:MAG: hypothetical protein P8Z79_01505, partial [Sedimentisphaerales bacterium]
GKGSYVSVEIASRIQRSAHVAFPGANVVSPDRPDSGLQLGYGQVTRSLCKACAKKRPGEVKMVKSNHIKEELLKQMEKDFAESTDVDKDSTRKIVENHRAQVRRLKRITITSWAITVIYLLAMYILKETILESHLRNFLSRDEFLFIRYADMGTKVLIVISGLLTYLLYYRSKMLTMLQICARLANIEEHLKSMTQE